MMVFLVFHVWVRPGPGKPVAWIGRSMNVEDGDGPAVGCGPADGFRQKPAVEPVSEEPKDYQQLFEGILFHFHFLDPLSLKDANEE